MVMAETCIWNSDIPKDISAVDLHHVTRKTPTTLRELDAPDRVSGILYKGENFCFPS